MRLVIRKSWSFLPVILIFVLIISFVLPANSSRLQAASSESTMEWWPVDTPDSSPYLKNLYSPIIPFFGEGGSEFVKLLVGRDGYTMYAIVSSQVPNIGNTSKLVLMKSGDGGISWGGVYGTLCDAFTGTNVQNVIVWDIAIAPDNPEIVAAAVSLVTDPTNQKIFFSVDGGTTWNNSLWPPPAPQDPAAGYAISALDISMNYGGFDMLVGVRNGTAPGLNNLWIMRSQGYSGWNVQSASGTPASASPFAGDVVAARFSPTYNGDSTVAVVFSTNTGVAATTGTYLITGVRDIAKNFTTWQPASSAVEIKRPTDPAGLSPGSLEIITADLKMPSDFSGQSASLRRFYISTDASGANGTVARGVFRVDDTTVYCLMDNTSTFQIQSAAATSRRVASIDYWGTYASGKLLVGERLGKACTASVPVWFTDSPTVCPVPCWYSAKKPPTGAAGYDWLPTCTANLVGYGNASVAWSPAFAGQGVAYAATGAMSYDGGFVAITNQANDQLSWPGGIFNIVLLDESAFSLTRNNGETWNQLSAIDTRIIKLTDVAPSADCTTVYLATVNDNIHCSGFDSVWRSSTNEKVVSPPLPGLPIGNIWERVYCRVTAASCNQVQANYAILRLAPDRLDGQIVGWAAGGTSGLDYIGGFRVGPNTRAMAWSPDFGDYWADINPRVAVQDFAFESSTVLYVLQSDGNVQKMPYTGTAWASSTLSVSSMTGKAHTIEAMAPDKVLVAQAAGASNTDVVGYSSNGGTSFMPMGIAPSTPASVGYHAIFDTDFAKNATVYLASDQGFNTASIAWPTVAGSADVNTPAGLVFRNLVPAGSNSNWTDMLTGANYIGYGPASHRGYYGLAQTNSKNVTGQGTLYAAHTIQATGTTATDKLRYSGVERTLSPLDGIPKPGLEWSCMDASDNMYRPRHALFTLEPKSLKLCGCLSQITNASLYAIDNDYYSGNNNATAGRRDRWGDMMTLKTTGLLWEYTDCVAKKGPILILDDGAIIGCDPASGRNQEVNFRWEQLCLATVYQLQIAKDKAFTLQVFDTGKPYGPSGQGLMPADVTAPAYVFFSAGKGSMPGLPTTLITQADTSVKFVTPELECGHGYFWRVRVLDETSRDMVNSPWSDARSFTIKAGFRVTTPYYGPQLLAPDNGCGCACNAPIAFSWSPFKETIEYQFVLSENADLSSPLVSTAVKTTAYQFTGTAKCNKTYFWRVMANKPAPSEWSAVFSFNTQPEPPKPAAPPPAPGTPIWVWMVIGIGAILVIVILVLIVRTRRE
jgi:hypothetical protein